MNYSDKCQLVLYMINKVDYFWNRLYVSTSVVIGFILGHELLKLNPCIVILLFMIYVIYLGGNLWDHSRAYRFLILLLDEIKNSPDEFKGDVIMTEISKLPYKKEKYTCIAAYIAVLGIVSYIAFK